MAKLPQVQSSRSLVRLSGCGALVAVSLFLFLSLTATQTQADTVTPLGRMEARAKELAGELYLKLEKLHTDYDGAVRRIQALSHQQRIDRQRLGEVSKRILDLGRRATIDPNELRGLEAERTLLTRNLAMRTGPIRQAATTVQMFYKQTQTLLAETARTITGNPTFVKYFKPVLGAFEDLYWNSLKGTRKSMGKAGVSAIVKLGFKQLLKLGVVFSFLSSNYFAAASEALAPAELDNGELPKDESGPGGSWAGWQKQLEELGSDNPGMFDRYGPTPEGWNEADWRRFVEVIIGLLSQPLDQGCGIDGNSACPDAPDICQVGEGDIQYSTDPAVHPWWQGYDPVTDMDYTYNGGRIASVLTFFPNQSRLEYLHAATQLDSLSTDCATNIGQLGALFRAYPFEPEEIRDMTSEYGEEFTGELASRSIDQFLLHAQHSADWLENLVKPQLQAVVDNFTARKEFCDSNPLSHSADCVVNASIFPFAIALYQGEIDKADQAETLYWQHAAVVRNHLGPAVIKVERMFGRHTGESWQLPERPDLEDRPTDPGNNNPGTPGVPGQPDDPNDPKQDQPSRQPAGGGIPVAGLQPSDHLLADSGTGRRERSAQADSRLPQTDSLSARVSGARLSRDRRKLTFRYSPNRSVRASFSLKLCDRDGRHCRAVRGFHSPAPRTFAPITTTVRLALPAGVTRQLASEISPKRLRVLVAVA